MAHRQPVAEQRADQLVERVVTADVLAQGDDAAERIDGDGIGRAEGCLRGRTAVAAEAMSVNAGELKFSWPNKAGFVTQVKYTN